MKRKKGTTILELIITMAAVSVMSIMVTSFYIAAHSWVSLGTNRYNLMKSQSLFEKLYTMYLEENDDDATYFTLNADGGKLLLVRGNETKEISFDEERSVITLPRKDREDSEIFLDGAERVLFNVENKKDADGDIVKQMVICRIFYRIDGVSKHGSKNDGIMHLVFTTKVDKKISEE